MSAPGCPPESAGVESLCDKDCKADSTPVVVPVSAPSPAPVHSQKLSVLQLTAICFFAVAGGPFGFEEVIGSAGATWAYIGLIVLPLIWSIPIALMTAELATLIPDMGGQITWVERGLGPTAGFANSMLCLLTTFSDNAIYPVMFMDYLNRLKGGSELSAVFSWLTRTGVVAACALLNIRGVDVLGDATISFGVIVMTPFVIMACMGLMTKATSPPVAPNRIMWGSFLSTMMWSTSGFDSAGTCAADVKDPGRTFPKAVGLSVILVIGSYIVPISAALKVMPSASLWEDGTWVTAAEILAGQWLAAWVAVAAMVSSVGILSTMLCTTSRQLVGIAENGHLPLAKLLVKEHPAWETPYVMITVNAIISLIFTSLDFEGLAQVTTVFYSASTIMRFVSLWRLRHTMADAERPFTIPGGQIGLCITCIPPIALSFLAASQCETTELITVLTCMGGVLLATLAHALCVRSITPESTGGGVRGSYATLDDEATTHKIPVATCIEIPLCEVPSPAAKTGKPSTLTPRSGADAAPLSARADAAKPASCSASASSSPKRRSVKMAESSVAASASVPSTPRVPPRTLSLTLTTSHDDGVPLLLESGPTSDSTPQESSSVDNARR